ncbi:putative transport system, permease protein [Pectobacterium atrosepticum SCRI1043]|uniref:Transport system, permease protein n=1 Tax=Pectobacterium atrosepticum (strain SCRI 1043 / ATCC BAA-672) TaxID=218491 RepID=Q6D5I4_PECAS|nr:ABC transporter permease [Pectobacterium atrosepticum]GKV83847.1 ABC transporter permease [Pectobacterium carotovorum subsp. carotovorum]AIA70888.1 polyamine ABC transporter substrate-binding protein [Pectobacterium atrosepticum]AIK14339.1 ABC transporter, permease protein [Pectobacterium atrosepticum]ATY91093.1 ABC transporter permease [Pectobacterium atrosepticum]KFX12964.1 polyamine ABC transporter substrate-binding protein [Pectobacterium atrosepticum]
MSQSEIVDSAPPSGSEEDSTLKQQLRIAQKAYKKRSLLLIAPLFLFIVVSFLFPITSILGKSVSNPELRDNMPQTIAAMRLWSGNDVPDEAVFRALVGDLRDARSSGKLSTITKRLGYEGSEYRTLITRTLRKLPAEGSSDMRDQLIREQPMWGALSTWQTFDRAARPFTSYYLLAVFDHKVDATTQQIVPLPADQALYVDVLLRTLLMAGVVTLLCVGLGYPLAYWLAKQPSNRANLLLILVLLPFWTSLIVRTASWIVLLQSGGLINRSLMSTGIIDEPLVLVFNRIGVYISMTHILLPFFILPLYAVMKGISPNYVRAAISLGAHPFIAFWRVYVPQTYAGVTAGALLVFMMAIGYYITPALLGGPSDQMLSYFVAFFTNTTMNWGMAAALGTQLLIIVTLLYVVYIRVTRTNAEAAAH